MNFFIDKQSEENEKEMKSLFKETDLVKNKIQELDNFVSKLSFQNIHENTDEEVQEYLQLLNEGKNIDDNNIQFTKQLSTVHQNQPSEEEISYCQQNTQKILQKIKYKIANNKEVEECLMASVILQNYYEQNNIKVYLSDKQENHNSQEQNTILFTGNFQQGQYFSIKIKDQEEQLAALQSKDSLHQYVENLKNQIGNHIGINKQEIKNSIILMRVDLNDNVKMNFLLKNQSQDKFNKLRNFSTPKIKAWVQNLIDHSTISINFFDPEFDMKWSSHKAGDYGHRGKLKFKTNKRQFDFVDQPYYYPVGFQGYGLNVKNKYGKDHQWIERDTNEKTWIVLFHGTADTNIQSILEQNLKSGENNAFGGNICRITKETISSGSYANVYLSDRVEEAENYCQPNAIFNGRKYLVVFQCKVNPEGVRSPEECASYYTVQNPQHDIRPYRLLIKWID